jgi:peptidyl-dipeptidase A
MGELMASQVHNYLVNNIPTLDSDRNVSYVNQPKVGRYIRKNILAPGSIYHWNDMIERATGEPLTPKYFVTEFVK